MGLYLYPGNEGFKNIINGIYRDKMGLIGVVNSTINTPDKLTCISRPRRFGKSYAAKMLCAYYDKSCSDSKELFSKQEYAISMEDSFEKYLGQFNVIYLDITGFISSVEDIKKLVRDIKDKIIAELLIEYSYLTKEISLTEMLVKVAECDSKFFFIIDEWDALFREYKAEEELLNEYMNFLRELFNCDEEAVAKAIQDAHDAGTFGVSPLFYNDEQALRSVVKFAYISCANSYIKIEELPSGHGYADIVYIPKAGSGLPVLLIELKMDGSEDGASAQIERGNYPKVFENIDNEIILCGINYDGKSKSHACKIKKINPANRN